MLILNNSELKIEGILITNFKTSYVDIKQTNIQKMQSFMKYFKTSYVDFKPASKKAWFSQYPFQNIIC